MKGGTEMTPPRDVSMGGYFLLPQVIGQVLDRAGPFLPCHQRQLTRNHAALCLM
jgi:hypothetical protein